MAKKKKADATTLTLGTVTMTPINDIRPYWRNPRRVSEESVNMLARSIRDYGYQQPIVVDNEGIIVVGHTRYAALRRLKVDQVPIQVADTLTPEQVKRYRLIDNKVAELTTWDFDALTEELGDLDSELMVAFFPEIGSTEDFQAGAEAVLDGEWSEVDNEVEFICPSCFHGWETSVTREDVLAGTVRATASTETTSEETA